MKYLRYGWTVFKNLITLVIVVLIFNSLNSNFEFLVVSILILLYTSIHLVLLSQNSRFAEIYRILGERPNLEGIDETIAEGFIDKAQVTDFKERVKLLTEKRMSRSRDELKRGIVEMIDYFGLGIAELIALWYLITKGINIF